jgi:Protein of unknown function (DUF4199)
MKQNILIFGIIAGIVSIMLEYIIYKLNANWLFTFGFTIGLKILIGIVIFLAIKKTIQPNEAFKQIIKVGFLVFLIGNGLLYLFEYNLYNHIDPNLAKIEKNAWLEYTSQGKNPSEISTMRDTMKDVNFHELKTTLFNMLRGALAGFVLSGVLTFLYIKIESSKDRL